MMCMKQFTNTYNNNYESKCSLKVMSLWWPLQYRHHSILYGPFAPALLTVSSYVRWKNREEKCVTSRYHGSTISGWQQNQRRRRRPGERQKITNNNFARASRYFSNDLDSTWICLDLEMPHWTDPAERAMAGIRLNHRLYCLTINFALQYFNKRSCTYLL